VENRGWRTEGGEQRVENREQRVEQKVENREREGISVFDGVHLRTLLRTLLSTLLRTLLSTTFLTSRTRCRNKYLWLARFLDTARLLSLFQKYQLVLFS
jgi:hypothetical protein